MRASLWLMVVITGCAQVAGLGELEFEPSGQGGSSSSAGGAGGSSSAATGGEGGGPCELSNCPMPSTSCAAAACVNAACDFTFEDQGISCNDGGGSYCDGSGRCVECTQNNHCPNNGVCQQNTCYASSCNDQMQNGTETGVDCGGTCGGCPNGGSCNTSQDCASLVCMNFSCVPCAQHADCAAAYYCQLSAGVCLAKKAFGEVCGNAYECVSNNCTSLFLCGL